MKAPVTSSVQTPLLAASARALLPRLLGHTAIGYRPPAIGHRLLAIGYFWLRTTHHASRIPSRS